MTKRPRRICAVGSGCLSSRAVSWFATALEAVGPTDSESSPWLWVLEWQSSTVYSSGSENAAHAGIM